MQLWQACICMRCAWISLDHCHCVPVCEVYTVAGLKVSVVKRWLGRQCVFSHEETLTAGCSPGKALGESPADPEDRPTENTHNWLWDSQCPHSLEPLSLCHDKDKLHPPPLTQKHFGAFGFWWWSAFYGSLGRRKLGEMLWCVWSSLRWIADQQLLCS